MLSLTSAQVILQASLLSLLLLFSFPLLSLLLGLAALCLLYHHLFLKPHPILLLDFSCYKPPDSRKCSYEISEHFVRKTMRFSLKSEEFMRSIFLKSGLGNETYAPPFVFDHFDEAKFQSAIQEAQEGMFSAVDSLLSKAKIDPRNDIDIVIVTCGSFSPSPSLSSLLVNHYQMRPTVRTFNLNGMGCSSGVLSLDMAARMLRGRNVQNALVVISENISLNWYYGDDRSKLVTNCIFRVGCAAALVTNDPARARFAKFRLVHSVRTHHGADDASYLAAFQEEDEMGKTGVSLTKDLIRVAGKNLHGHIRVLAPRVLPLSQLVQHVKAALLTQRNCESKPVVPDFMTAFEHVCIHTGGKAVIEQVGKVLRLGDWVTEPARMTLHRFGNTSSSLVFYELAYFEAKGRIKRGDKVWVLAFGTGFKVGSLVLKAITDSGFDCDNPWNDSIHRYPLKSW